MIGNMVHVRCKGAFPEDQGHRHAWRRHNALSCLEAIDHRTSTGAGKGRRTLNAEEITAGIASFYYDLTCATAAASLDCIRQGRAKFAA